MSQEIVNSSKHTEFSQPLPDQVKLFALLFDGDIVKAMKAVNVEGVNQTLRDKGRKWLKNDQVKKIIKARLKQKHSSALSDIKDRQAMWARASQCQDPRSLAVLERIEAGLWQLGQPLNQSGLSPDEWGNLNIKVGKLLISLQQNALKASEILGKSQADFIDVTVSVENLFTYDKGLDQLKKHLQGSPQLENQINQNLLDFVPNEDDKLSKIIDIDDFVYKPDKKAA